MHQIRIRLLITLKDSHALISWSIHSQQFKQIEQV